ncbi:DUF3618 domain-containing protein [Streptomyces adustus]
MSRPLHEGPTTATPEELREQLDRTRRELGATVAALAAKTDVKARAQAKAVRIGRRTATSAAVLRERLVLRAERAERPSGPVRDGTALGLRLSRDHRVMLVTGAAVAGAGWLLWRRKG